MREKKNTKRQSVVLDEDTDLQETSEMNAVKEDLADSAGLSNEDAPSSRGRSFFQRIFGDNDDQSDASQEF